MSLPVAILAGGLATRLQPVTQHLPKSLVEVAGRPFAVHQVELLRRNGITDITFLIGHLGDMIRDVLSDGSSWGVRIRYIPDGPRGLGTGGALRKALPSLDDPFFVLYGDSYLECDYAAVEDMFLAGKRRGLMTVCRNDNQWDRSNVVLSGGEIVTYDKQHCSPEMRHIDYGLGVFRHAAFEGIRDDAFDVASIYQDLLRQHDLACFEVPGRFYEIGSPAGLEETRRYLARKEPSFQ